MPRRPESIAAHWFARLLGFAWLIACALTTACQPQDNAPDPIESYDSAIPADADQPVRAQFHSAIADLSLARRQSDTALIAQAFGNLGMLYQAYGYPEPARQHYRDALRIDSDDLRWTYYLAHVERALGDYDAAARLFATSLALSPESTASRVWLAESYFDAGDLDQAEHEFDKALLVDPACNRALAGLGRVALERGDYDRAISILGRATKSQPRVASLNYQLASAYRATNDQANSTRYMQNASRLQTSDVILSLDDPMLDRIAKLPAGHEKIQLDALRALLDGDFNTAVRLYRQALLIQPENHDNRYNLVLALSTLGHNDEALIEIQEALKHNPNDVDMHVFAARLYAKRRQMNEVEEHLMMASRVDPQNVEVQLRLGNVYRLGDRLPLAAHHYDEAIRLDDGAADAYVGKAIVLIQTGQPDQALDVLATGLRNNPDNPQLRDAHTNLSKQLASN